MLVELVSFRAPVIGPLTGGISVYKEGFAFGARQSLRLVIVVCVSSWVVSMISFDKLLYGFGALRLPSRLVLVVAITARLLLQLTGDLQMIYAVQRLRGRWFVTFNPLEIIRSLLVLLRSLVVVIIRWIVLFDIVLLARGIDVSDLSAARLIIVDGRLIFLQRLAIVVLLAALFLAVLIKLLAGLDLFFT